CDRVLRSDGGISGYRWGVDRKLRLIELERELAAGSGASRRCTATPSSSWCSTFPGKTSPPECLGGTSTSSSTSSAHPSEALVRHFQSDAISLLQHLGQRQWLGQLVAHEVLAGPELALVEGFGLDTIALQPAQRGLGLTQPHPTD